jgi:hypothetical protein
MTMLTVQAVYPSQYAAVKRKLFAGHPVPTSQALPLDKAPREPYKADTAITDLAQLSDRYFECEPVTVRTDSATIFPRLMHGAY